MLNTTNSLLSFESFAAKDANGHLAGLMLSVPHGCGLEQADTLRVNGLTVLAMRNQSVLPLDFANLMPATRADFLALSKTGQRIAVAEFTAIGLANAYFLKLLMTGDL